MKILITGLGGFVGPYLADYCLQKGDDVFGTLFPGHKSPREKLNTFECDLNAKERLKEILREVGPDIIFHLAAQSSSTADSFSILFNNVNCQVNLFEVLRELNLNPVCMIACSALEYGFVEKNPVKESFALRPLSPYAISKAAQEMAAFYYFKQYGLKAVIIRAFNHTGPGQRNAVLPSFCRQIAEIEAGKKEAIIKVGNLDVHRDFTDVRDIVRAYFLSVKHCSFGEPYNVGSGESRKIQDMLEALLCLSSKKIKIEQDPDLMRKNDIPKIQADISKFSKETGWRPEIPFEKTLKDTLNYWRNEVKHP